MPTNGVTLAPAYASVPPPVIGSFQFTVPNTSLLLNAQGMANQTWVLQTSSNLTTWSDLLTDNSDGAGKITFPINSNPGAKQQFFRIRSGP